MHVRVRVRVRVCVTVRDAYAYANRVIGPITPTITVVEAVAYPRLFTVFTICG